VKGNWLPPWY